MSDPTDRGLLDFDDGHGEYEHTQELTRVRKAKRRAKAVALLGHASHGSQHRSEGDDEIGSPARPAPLEEGPDAMTDGLDDRRIMVVAKGDLAADGVDWTLHDALELPYSPRDDLQSHQGVLTWLVEGAAGVNIVSQSGPQPLVAPGQHNAAPLAEPRSMGQSSAEDRVQEVSRPRPSNVPKLNFAAFKGNNDEDQSDRSAQSPVQSVQNSLSVQAAIGRNSDYDLAPGGTHSGFHHVDDARSLPVSEAQQSGSTADNSLVISKPYVLDSKPP